MQALLSREPVDSDEMNTQADRVLALLKARGVADRRIKPVLAEVCGIKYQSVQQWFSGASKSIQAEHLAKIALHWHANLAWLVNGKGGMDIPSAQDNTPEGDNFAPPANLSYRRLPLVSWVQAGAWSEAEDPLQPGDAEDWCNVIAKVSLKSFVLRVRGDSMTSPYGPISAPEGSLIVVDPECQAENGNLVIAKLDGSNEATFKKLVFESGLKYLKPLNPDYKMVQINGDCRVIGVVKQILIDL